jgi:mRNA interferase HigB
MSTLRAFWASGHADAEQPLRAWFDTAEKADWRSLADVRRTYPGVYLLGDKLIFNIKGNRYRLICRIQFGRSGLFVKWIGSHAEYSKLTLEQVKAL